MSNTHLKLIVAGLAIAGAAVVLAVAGAREGWVYYLPVDDFVAVDRPVGQRVRLHGSVGAEDLAVSRALVTAEFDLHGDTGQVRIAYEGPIPDNFEAGCDVVVEGALDATGVFRADTLLTKCASKYEAEDGAAPTDMPGEPAA